MADNGLTNILGQASITNNPKFLSPQGANLGGALFGLGGGKGGGNSASVNADPNRSTLAEHSPVTLPDPEKDMGKIIGGALMKSPISAHQPQLEGSRDLSIDTSNLGHFGEVNSNAGTNATGAPAQSNKQSFWNTTGGGIASSLLGILALGGLGAGIGAISGGRRGAANGASYGMGLGTLQDLALRKEGMQSGYNQQQAALKLAEINKPDKGALQKDIEFMKANPQDQGLVKDYFQAKNPFGAENLLIRQEGLNLQADKEKRIEEQNIDNKVQALGKEAKPIKSVLNTYDYLEKQLGFNLDSFDREKQTAIDKDGKVINVDIPGVSNPLTGKRVTAYDLTGKAQSIDSTMQTIMNLDIKQFAGSAVAAQEMERIQRAYAAGAYRTDSDKLEALKKFRQLMREGLKDTEAGYSPQVQQKYRENRPNDSGSTQSQAATVPQDDYTQQLLRRRQELLQQSGQ